MSRGITETDVWQAADALLLEGQRPTIERVRQKIGRGSPNTVTPYLETWFRHLGGRIRDPGAFSAPPTLPEPIHQAAQHFWEVALTEARKEASEQIAQAIASANAAVEEANQRAEASDRLAAGLGEKVERLSNELATACAALTDERISHQATLTRLELALAQLSTLESKRADLEVTLARIQSDTRDQISNAEARADSAEKRAALDMDRERVARSKAEKRVEATERALAVAQMDLTHLKVKQAEELAVSTSKLVRLGLEHNSAVEQRDAEIERSRQASRALEESQIALATSHAELTLTKQMLADFMKSQDGLHKRRRRA